MSIEINSVGTLSAPRVGVSVPIASVNLPKSSVDPAAKPVEKDMTAVRQAHVSQEVAQNTQHMMQQVEAVVEQLNKLAVNNGRGVSFTADEKLGVNIITVTNTTTGDVVRTIPTAVAIKAANGIKDFEDMLLKFKGLLHDSAA